MFGNDHSEIAAGERHFEEYLNEDGSSTEMVGGGEGEEDGEEDSGDSGGGDSGGKPSGGSDLASSTKDNTANYKDTLKNELNQLRESAKTDGMTFETAPSSPSSLDTSSTSSSTSPPSPAQSSFNKMVDALEKGE